MCRYVQIGCGGSLAGRAITVTISASYTAQWGSIASYVSVCLQGALERHRQQADIKREAAEWRLRALSS